MVVLFRLLLFLLLAWLMVTVFNHCFYTPVNPEDIQLRQVPSVTLAEARDDANLYDEIIQVSATCAFELYIGFFNVGVYVLADGTARMLVWKRGVPPAVGKKVHVVLIPRPVFRINGYVFVTATEVAQVEDEKPVRRRDRFQEAGGL